VKHQKMSGDKHNCYPVPDYRKPHEGWKEDLETPRFGNAEYERDDPPPEYEREDEYDDWPEEEYE
jgi:hypothetical protein